MVIPAGLTFASKIFGTTLHTHATPAAPHRRLKGEWCRNLILKKEHRNTKWFSQKAQQTAAGSSSVDEKNRCGVSFDLLHYHSSAKSWGNRLQELKESNTKAPIPLLIQAWPQGFSWSDNIVSLFCCKQSWRCDIF